MAQSLRNSLRLRSPEQHEAGIWKPSSVGSKVILSSLLPFVAPKGSHSKLNWFSDCATISRGSKANRMAKGKAGSKGGSKQKIVKDDTAKEAVTNLDRATSHVDPSVVPGYIDSLLPNTDMRDLLKYADYYRHVDPSHLQRLADFLRSVDMSDFLKYADIDPGGQLAVDSIRLRQDLEDRIGELRQESKKLRERVIERRRALEKKEIETSELEKSTERLEENQEEIAQQQRLQYLFYKVHPTAWERLKRDEAFRKSFYRDTPCPMFVMSIDIRKSTELMLNAKDPTSYQGFIITLCTELKQIILENYGVFDKFTGDGILAFFPDFYSGEDAAYCAIKAAAECHDFFSNHYKKNRSCFTVVMRDIGLCIGIDFGATQLVNVQDWLTPIGTPVVYACRLSGAEAGHTLLAQQAYDEASRKFGEFINLREYEQPFKHQGTVIAYTVSLAEKAPNIKPPDWLTGNTPLK